MQRSEGTQDLQTVGAGGRRATEPNIAGVRIVELGNVITRSGWMTEVFRTDWPGVEIVPRQINFVHLSPNGVTDWHRHTGQTDHLIGVGGVIKLVLCDGRPGSPTERATDVIRFGAIRPLMVIIPAGVWHALRNESGEPAAFLNITDQLYAYERPDNWRLPAEGHEIPDIL